MNDYSIYPKQFNNNGNQIQINTCFVIMPFSDELDNTYMVIDSVATSMGIHCTRADNISTTSEPILNKICTQISQAYYIIVDITNLNPNVFYELGIAHVLRDAKKVLIIKDDKTECPSDIKHLHYYSYNNIALKQLKTTVKNFFRENNIYEDVLGVLDFLGITSKKDILSQNFVVSLSNCLKDDMNSLVLILNNKTSEITESQANNLLYKLTHFLNDLSSNNKLYPLFFNLTLLLIQKINYIFDISEYLSQLCTDVFHNLPNELIADCCITVLDNSRYFDVAVSWIVKYLMKISPAAFDIAKYKIEIGIIKSNSEKIDNVLINNLRNCNKTLVEHCIKLIKEREDSIAIPTLVELLENDENPYVVRSCIDALVKMAPLNTLIKVRKIMQTRKSLVDSHTFISKHLVDLEHQIGALQNASNN